MKRALPKSSPGSSTDVGDQMRQNHQVLRSEEQCRPINQSTELTHEFVDEQQARLIQSKLGVAELKDVELVKGEHTRLFTLLNEIRKEYQHKETALRKLEQERDQLRSSLAEANSQITEMESLYRSEIQSASEAWESAHRENQTLQKRLLSLQERLRHVAVANTRTANLKDPPQKISAHRVAANSANSPLEAPGDDSNAIKEVPIDGAVDTRADSAESSGDKNYWAGVKYVKGDGVKKSEKAAIKYFEKAARLGHCAAQLNLGVLKYKGSADIRDLTDSVHWLSLAAAQGHATAISLLPEVQAAQKMDEPRDVAM